MKNNLEVSSRVQEIIEQTFKLSHSGGEAYAMGAVPGWDSLGHMRLILELENEFGVTFPTYTLAELTSVPAIVDALDSLN